MFDMPKDKLNLWLNTQECSHERLIVSEVVDGIATTAKCDACGEDGFPLVPDSYDECSHDLLDMDRKCTTCGETVPKE